MARLCSYITRYLTALYINRHPEFRVRAGRPSHLLMVVVMILNSTVWYPQYLHQSRLSRYTAHMIKTHAAQQPMQAGRSRGWEEGTLGAGVVVTPAREKGNEGAQKRLDGLC